jgi:hypothetical protein
MASQAHPSEPRLRVHRGLVVALAAFVPLLVLRAAAPAAAASRPAAYLQATVAPSPFIPAGGTADVMAGGAGRASLAGVTVRLHAPAGTVRLVRPTAAQRARGVVAVLRAGAAVARATVTVRDPGSAAQTLPVRVYTKASQLVSGKGAWASFGTYSALGAAAILQRSAREGVTHLYLETTGVRFVGQPQLNSILQAAHNLGIAVIAWDYASLRSVPAEIRSADATVSYTTALGAQVDGLAGDFEANLAAGAMRAFSAAVRQAEGKSRAYVGIIYPPQFGFATPIATMARYVDVFAPMDYWLSAPRVYTAGQAAAFVTRSIQELRATPGEGGVPIEVVSQTQNIENSSGFGIYNPPPAQIVASTHAAIAAGAIGVSYYDLRTQTAAQMSTIASLSVPSQLR